MALAMSFKCATALFAIASSLPPALCHLQMSWPYALRSKYNPNNDASIIDYNMMSPLEADGSNYPCKGYQNDRPIEPVATYIAGSTYNMTLTGSATHGGGSCQLSLSYDNGATFRVIKSMIGGCPLQMMYDFTIPSYAPAGGALFAWTWQNKIGNREFYMNCAAVTIVSSTARSRGRDPAFSKMRALPFIWRANLQGLDECATQENTDPVYPNAGPDVVYGDGLSSSSPPNIGSCNAPMPFGRAYKAMDDTMEAIAFAGPNDTAMPTSSGQVPASTTSFTGGLPASMQTFTFQSSLPDSVNPMSSQTEATSGYSTTTLMVECPNTVVVTIFPTNTTTTTTSLPATYTTSAPASVCTGTKADCPCAPGYACLDVGPCTWACRAQSTLQTLQPTSSFESPTTAHTTSNRDQTSTKSPPASTTTVGTSSLRPGYVNPAEVGRFRPCDPGTFICTSSTVWYTCDYDGQGGISFTEPRQVSAGMMCLPNYSQYSAETQQYGQQAVVPAGYYRDDRIVRERPYGDCDHDGSLRCLDDGTSFQICDQGGWVDMGSVAPGTTCRNDQIVGL